MDTRKRCVISRTVLWLTSISVIAGFIIIVVLFHQPCESLRCITLRNVFPSTHAIVTAVPSSSEPTPIWLPPIVPLSRADPTIIHIATTAWSVSDVAFMATLLQRLIKSTLISAPNRHIVFHVIANVEVMQHIDSTLWHGLCEVRRYDHSLQSQWLTLFATGSAQRLFLHTLLPLSIEKVIYLDVDCIVLRDVYELWQYFDVMKKDMWFGVARESEIIDSSYYLQVGDVHVPFVPPVGINAGVLLLYLSRLRHIEGYAAELDAIFTRYKGKLYVGDQDILNIYGHWHPESYHLLPCGWNVREDSYCNFDAPGDLAIVHGSRGIFDDRRRAPHTHYFHELADVIDQHPFWHGKLWNYQYGAWRRRAPSFLT